MPCGFIYNICGPDQDTAFVYKVDSFARWDPSPIQPLLYLPKLLNPLLPHLLVQPLDMRSFTSITTLLSLFAFRQFSPSVIF